MNSIENLHFEVWTDGDDKRIAMHAKLPKDSELYSIYFIFSEEEFNRFVRGSWETFVDGFHNCKSVGDLAMFYDINLPKRNAYGIMNVPYYSLQFPTFARKITLRAANKIWAKNSIERETINVSQERAARWVKQYGQGKGEVELELSNERVVEDYKKAYTAGGNFQENIDRLKQIAQNGTNAFFQKGKVRLMYDSAGFLFDIVSPKGKATMFGGLINHGRDGNVDWSIHT